MIAYCGREHQVKHWQRHKDLCKLLAGVVKQAGSAFGLRAKREPSMQAWTRAKTNLMLLVQMKLGRKLQPYETEMFKFPRACAVCHETDSTKLVDCSDCPGTSFCSEHRCDNAHNSKCDTLKLCFEIETGYIDFSLSMREIIDTCHFQNGNIPKTMQEVVELCATSDRHVSLTSNVRAVHLSEYLTRPLTFLRAMDILYFEKLACLTVHVIGANAIETESLVYWETLLHCKETITELRVILVGPELHQQSYLMTLCEDCTARDAKIYVRTMDMLYSDYVASKTFVQADCIIGFNLGIHEYEDHSSINDTWSASIKELAKQDCPIVMTSYTLQESHEERKRLASVLGSRVDFCYTGKNPFSSLRPYRDFESEDFFYQNNYMTVYKKIVSR